MPFGLRSLLDGTKTRLRPGGAGGGAPTGGNGGDGGDGGDGSAARTTPVTAAAAEALFPATDPAVDGDDCAHDCASCTVHYPRGFKVERGDRLYGKVDGWGTHLLVATGKADWVRDVADETGSVMEAVDAAMRRGGHGKDGARMLPNGRLMLSASNMPTPGGGGGGSSPYGAPTRVLLLPAFVVVDGVTPARVPDLLAHVGRAPASTTLLGGASDGADKADKADNTTDKTADADKPAEETAPPPASPVPAGLAPRPCPHSALILLCSQKTRDARCGQSAPLLRRELERHLRPLGLYRDLDDDRPGGVGIYFVSHVGGHKYSANLLVYRRPDAFGLDRVDRGGGGGNPDADRAALFLPAAVRAAGLRSAQTPGAAAGAAQCIWLARVAPEDCENIVRYTVLQGKVVKPATQLRGGFDREKGLLSW